MQRKKLASSKSKSQIVTQQLEPTAYYFDPYRPVQSKSKSQTCDRCHKFLHHRFDEPEYTTCIGCDKRVCFRCESPHSDLPVCIDCYAKTPSAPTAVSDRNESIVPSAQLSRNDQNDQDRAAPCSNKFLRSFDDTRSVPQSVTNDHLSTPQGRTKNLAIKHETLHSPIASARQPQAIQQSRRPSLSQPKSPIPSSSFPPTNASSTSMNKISHDDESCCPESVPRSVSTKAAPYPHNSAITGKRAMPHEPPSEPEPYQTASDAAEVVITKNSGFWCTMFGSHKSRILDEDKQPFSDRDDPVMVAKYLASHARGPINVIWW